MVSHNVDVTLFRLRNIAVLMVSDRGAPIPDRLRSHQGATSASSTLWSPSYDETMEFLTNQSNRAALSAWGTSSC
jgi:hypothetical protein